MSPQVPPVGGGVRAEVAGGAAGQRAGGCGGPAVVPVEPPVGTVAVAGGPVAGAGGRPAGRGAPVRWARLAHDGMWYPVGGPRAWPDVAGRGPVTVERLGCTLPAVEVGSGLFGLEHSAGGWTVRHERGQAVALESGGVLAARFGVGDLAALREVLTAAAGGPVTLATPASRDHLFEPLVRVVMGTAPLGYRDAASVVAGVLDALCVPQGWRGPEHISDNGTTALCGVSLTVPDSGLPPVGGPQTCWDCLDRQARPRPVWRRWLAWLRRRGELAAAAGGTPVEPACRRAVSVPVTVDPRAVLGVTGPPAASHLGVGQAEQVRHLHLTQRAWQLQVQLHPARQHRDAGRPSLDPELPARFASPAGPARAPGFPWPGEGGPHPADHRVGPALLLAGRLLGNRNRKTRGCFFPTRVRTVQ